MYVCVYMYECKYADFAHMCTFMYYLFSQNCIHWISKQNTQTFLIIETISFKRVRFFFSSNFIVVFTMHSWPLNNVAVRGFDPSHTVKKATSIRPLVSMSIGSRHRWGSKQPQIVYYSIYWKKSTYKCTCAVQNRVVQTSVVLTYVVMCVCSLQCICEYFVNDF